MQDYRKNLDNLSALVFKAYLDSVMFLSIVPLATDKRKTSNFLFDYSYYTIRERAIIAVKSLIERQGKNRLTLERIIKSLEEKEEYKTYAEELYSQYKDLFDSDAAHRIKKFRDSLCHNIKDDCEIKIYCKDILDVMNGILSIIDNIYQLVFKEYNENFGKIQNLSHVLADDYWGAICKQADEIPNRYQELTELQKMFKHQF